MGQNASTSKRLFRAVVVGLDDAGKTSLLQRLSGEVSEAPHPQQTLGFNVSMLCLDTPEGRTKLQVWDPAGREDLRGLWKAYCAKAAALLFCVDASDRGRIEEAREELQRLLLNPDLVNRPILVVANKLDVYGSLTPSELEGLLGVHRHPGRIRRTQVIGVSCATGEGLDEIRAWLVDELCSAWQPQAPPPSSKSRRAMLAVPSAASPPDSPASGSPRARRGSLPHAGSHGSLQTYSLSSFGTSRDTLELSRSFDDLRILHPSAA